MKHFLSKHPDTMDNSSISYNRSKKILLVQLCSHGDCLYATTIAHQIKKDYPDCNLTWAIGSMYRSVLEGNPDIDEVWEIPFAKPSDIISAWEIFNDQVKVRQAREEFDEIFITQMQLFRYDETIRSSTFSGYPKPITVSVSPIVYLLPHEVENVRQFAELHKLQARDNVILIECSVKSNQSFITPDYALEIAEMIVNKFPNYCVILSSNVPIFSKDERIIDGSVLSFRENAELTKYCSFLIGGSSGITWISTSNWAKSLPMIQLINSDAIWFASVVYDHDYWGLSTNNIIELTPCTSDKVFKCFEMIFEKDFYTAKSKFHTKILPNFLRYQQLQYQFLTNYQFNNFYRHLYLTIHRNGFKVKIILYLLLNLVKFGAKKLFPPILVDFAIFLKQKLKYSQKLFTNNF